MYSQSDEGEKTPILIQRVKFLGAQGQYAWKPKDGKNDINNIQTSEQAFLQTKDSRLCIEFGLKVQQDAVRGANVESCSSTLLAGNLKSVADAYRKAGGYSILADAYAKQIVSASWMWRNRFGTDHLVTVTMFVDGVEQVQKVSSDDGVKAVSTLADVIAKGLAGEALIDLWVSGVVRLGFGQEVYPSQEFTGDTKGADDISRTYYKDENGFGMMHSQKIGNALRRIDTWHPHFEAVGEIAIEPYGSSIRDQKAFRYGNKRSFYDALSSLLVKGDETTGMMAVLKAKQTSDLDAIQDCHYFFAMLCRGGVLGMKN
jgi:CRISPR-associated protein Csy3